MLEISSVCSLKLKWGRVRHTVIAKYSVQTAGLMSWVDPHTQLKCCCCFFLFFLKQQPRNRAWRKDSLQCIPVSPLVRQTCGMCGQKTTGTLRGSQSFLLLILSVRSPGQRCFLSKRPAFSFTQSVNSSLSDWPQCDLEMKWSHSAAGSSASAPSLCNYLGVDHDVIITVMATSRMGN